MGPLKRLDIKMISRRNYATAKWLRVRQIIPRRNYRGLANSLFLFLSPSFPRLGLC